MTVDVDAASGVSVHVRPWLVGADEERVEGQVIPRARRNEVRGERSGRLVVRVVAAPVDDQANVAVRKLVADHLGIGVSRVEMVSGHH